MADRLKFNVIFRRTLRTNLRYYGGLIELMANYLQGLANIFSDFGQPSSVGAHEAHQPLNSRVVSPALVLEAESGEQAHGVFSIENNLARRVQAHVVVSPFYDPRGKEISLKLHFEPRTINLEPGEKLLVQAIVHIDEQLELDVRYRGQITVPDLSESPVSVVVRRRPSANLSRSAKVAKGKTGIELKRTRRTSRAPGRVQKKT
jgi:hypothetical protein